MNHKDNESQPESPNEPTESTGTVQIKKAPPKGEVTQQEDQTRDDNIRGMSPYEHRSVRAQWLICGITAIYAIFAGLQWHASNEILKATKENFLKTQRAAIYLGLPDGKIADFVSDGEDRRIALHFRNYGPTTAQSTIIEMWPIITAPDQPPVVTTFVPPQRSGNLGPNIPPGFPHIAYQPYPDATREELDSGQKHLEIIGRIRYSDSFEQYCETFAVAYNQQPFRSFTLTPYAGPNLCDAEEDTIRSWTIAVGTKGTQVFPFPEPSSQEAGIKQKQPEKQK